MMEGGEYGGTEQGRKEKQGVTTMTNEKIF
jgi:hypothetical protein